MISKEIDSKIRSAFTIISHVLDEVHDYIPTDIKSIVDAYRKINEGIIEFSQAMKDNLPDYREENS